MHQLRTGKFAHQFSKHRHECAISVLTFYELAIGINKSPTETLKKKKTKLLHEVLSLIKILPFDEIAASEAAKTQSALERQGTKIGQIDTLIAGHALSRNLTLVTLNLKEFQRVEHLKVISWD